jgi:RNA polymerase sigma factor (sigma-70 family)
MATQTTERIEACLDRLRLGDFTARNELIAHACGRLQRLGHKLFADFAGLRRWIDAEDVVQDASIRLARALDSVAPESPRQFFRLAALQIRRELLDLARHYRGNQGVAANHASWPGDSAAPLPEDRSSADPARLAEWTEWHERLAELPEEEREAAELLWYHGLTQHEAAALLDVPLRTLKRRWQQARLRLSAELNQQHGEDHAP